MEKQRFNLSDGQGCAIILIVCVIIIGLAYYFIRG